MNGLKKPIDPISRKLQLPLLQEGIWVSGYEGIFDCYAYTPILNTQVSCVLAVTHFVPPGLIGYVI